ncbi:CHAT domain-containing protein [bacterium]|nr:CHAT domain-containing protein [bacterium]
MICISAIQVCPVSAQRRAAIPDGDYFQGFGAYHQGEYRRAGKIFQRSHQSALKFGQQRYLDSVCSLTMMGECFFQVGDYASAIVLYEEAAVLYAGYVASDWQGRVKLPPAIVQRNGAVQAAQITWGVSQRNFVIPSMPNSMSVMFGELGGVQRAFAEGGVAKDAEFRPVNVEEIMRCVALALYRRNYIKGPTCRYDPLSAKLVDRLSGYAGGDGTLFGAWNGVLLGLAQASVGKNDQAVQKLTNSLQFNGGMDHSLTPIGLLALAELQRLKGENVKAGVLALEASFSAAIFGQRDLVADSMRLGAQVHLIDNRSVYPPLEAVLAWSRRGRNESRLCQAVTTIRLADCFAEMGDSVLCAQALNQAAQVLNRGDMGLTPEAGRAGFLSAVAFYIDGDYALGRDALSNALETYSRSSRWLYQLELAETLAVSGGVTERQADLLYKVLLRDPTAEEWQTDPIEAMTFMASNHLGAIERWFEIIVSRKDYNRAVEVSELLKRHRFFSTLPMGGRLLSFRWMMEAPAKNLSPDTLAQRADLHGRFAAYRPLSEQATDIQNELLKMPLKPADKTDEFHKQTGLFVKLQQVSLAQESMLASVALRRQPADMIFPPSVDMSALIERIDEEEIALVVVGTSSTTYMFGVSRRGTALLTGLPTKRLTSSIARLNRELLILDKQVDANDLAKQDKWKKISADLAETLFQNANAEQWASMKRLVLVPDGVTWYLPWEALRVGADEQNKKMLSEILEFRYSPTLGLAFSKPLPFHRIVRSAAFTSRLHSKAEEEQSKLAAEDLLVDLPGITIYDRHVMIPSNLLGVAADQFVVWSAIERSRRGILATYATNPIQLDSDRKSGSTLGSWLSLPYRSVDQIVMPGFISDGGGGKGKTAGNDLFLMTTGLLASGVRTVGISRWSTSGKSALDLSAEYLRQNKTHDPTTAWSKTIKTASQLKLDLAKEPKFTPSAKNKGLTLTAEHPLFWSGMIIVDLPAERPDDVDQGNDDQEDAAGADGEIADDDEGDGDKVDGNEGDGKVGNVGDENENENENKNEGAEAEMKEEGGGEANEGETDPDEEKIGEEGSTEGGGRN